MFCLPSPPAFLYCHGSKVREESGDWAESNAGGDYVLTSQHKQHSCCLLFFFSSPELCYICSYQPVCSCCCVQGYGLLQRCISLPQANTRSRFFHVLSSLSKNLFSPGGSVLKEKKKMQWIIDLCKKPSNKARRNLAGFQLCYRLKAQSRCVENFATVLQTAQQNWALLYSDWSWFLVSHGNMRKIQLPCGLWVKTSNWNRGTPNPQHTNQTKAKDLHKGCVPQCWTWQSLIVSLLRLNF